MRRAGAEPAACMPRVAHEPGRGRSVRRTCHVWHVRQARGGACGVRATCGTCAGQKAERAVCVPHVARAPGMGAGRAESMPRVALAPGMGRGKPGVAHAPGRGAAPRAACVRCACHTWQMRRAKGRGMPGVAHAPAGQGAARERACHTWHVRRARCAKSSFVSLHAWASLLIRLETA